MIYYFATFLLIVSGLPQTYKLVKTKKSKDISILMYYITTIAILLLFIRSINIKDLPLIIANGTSFIMTLINSILITKYYD